jgi:hypothetical protein
MVIVCEDREIHQLGGEQRLANGDRLVDAHLLECPPMLPFIELAVCVDVSDHKASIAPAQVASYASGLGVSCVPRLGA